MAQTIRFSQPNAEAFVAALNEDKPIAPPSGDRWTRDAMMQLAGACLFMLGFGDDAEVEGEEFFDDLEACIHWCAARSADVMEQEYDANFEAEHEATITASPSGEPHAEPVSGFRLESA